MSGGEARPAGPLFFGLRLGLWYATLFVVGSLVIVFLTYYLTAVSLAQRDQQIIRAKLADYAAVYARGGGGRVLAATVRAEQQAAPERLYVRIVDRGVETLVLSMPEGWDPATLETASARLTDGTLVEVGKSTEPRQALLSRFRAVLGLVTLSIVVIALTGGWLATLSALLPIRRLTSTVRSIIRTGRTDTRVPLAGTNDAIEELTQLFNVMLERIEGLVTAMRGSLDNVSHDLRTPLTRLRGTAEMALAAPADVEHYRDALAACVEEADRVLVMLNTLMDISEAESGAMQLRREPVALAEVVARAVDLYRDVAEAKGVALVVGDSPEPTSVPALAAPAATSVPGEPTSVPGTVGESSTSVPVGGGDGGLEAEGRRLAAWGRRLPGESAEEGRRSAARGRRSTGEAAAEGRRSTNQGRRSVVDADRTRLEQVAANLIDNAVKYTPAGGKVEVWIDHDPSTARLHVRDTGPGIPETELPRVWDRLFRGDASRSERGLGLGLSLVKAIVEAHGGSVSVASPPGRGATFTVSLPRLA